jgi:hypothetical protein
VRILDASPAPHSAAQHEGVKMTDKPDRPPTALFDATGIRRQAAAEQTGIATACLELHGFGPETSPSVFQIQLVVNVNSYPFIVLEGTIGGDIGRAVGTSWIVTEGSFGPYLLIEAKNTPLVNAPADAAALHVELGSQTVSISGDLQAPDSYAGVYGFDKYTSEYAHTTLFKGWQDCS